MPPLDASTDPLAAAEAVRAAETDARRSAEAEEEEHRRKGQGNGIGDGNPADAMLGLNVRPDVVDAPGGLVTITTQKSETFRAEEPAAVEFLKQQQAGAEPAGERDPIAPAVDHDVEEFLRPEQEPAIYQGPAAELRPAAPALHEAEPAVPELTLALIEANPRNAVDLKIPADAPMELLIAAHMAAKYDAEINHFLMREARAGTYTDNWSEEAHRAGEVQPDVHEANENLWLRARDRADALAGRIDAIILHDPESTDEHRGHAFMNRLAAHDIYPDPQSPEAERLDALRSAIHGAYDTPRETPQGKVWDSGEPFFEAVGAHLRESSGFVQWPETRELIADLLPPVVERGPEQAAAHEAGQVPAANQPDAQEPATFLDRARDFLAGLLPGGEAATSEAPAVDRRPDPIAPAAEPAGDDLRQQLADAGRDPELDRLNAGIAAEQQATRAAESGERPVTYADARDYWRGQFAEAAEKAAADNEASHEVETGRGPSPGRGGHEVF